MKIQITTNNSKLVTLLPRHPHHIAGQSYSIQKIYNHHRDQRHHKAFTHITSMALTLSPISPNNQQPSEQIFKFYHVNIASSFLIFHLFFRDRNTSIRITNSSRNIIIIKMGEHHILPTYNPFNICIYTRKE